MFGYKIPAQIRFYAGRDKDLYFDPDTNDIWSVHELNEIWYSILTMVLKSKKKYLYLKRLITDGEKWIISRS